MDYMMLSIGLLLAGFASLMIARACDGFEPAADYLGRDMVEGMKGAIINAIGSSMPEVCVTLIYLFVYADTTGFAGGIGATAGSAVFNSMVIPAVVLIALFYKNRETEIEVSKVVILRDGIALLVAEGFFICFSNGRIDWWHGLALVGIYAAYVGFLMLQQKSAKPGEEDEEDEDEFAAQDDRGPGGRFLAALGLDLEYAILGTNQITTGSALVLLAISTFFISVACWLLVHSCEMVGSAIGLHGYFIAVVLASAGSSVPDLILSMKDGLKGNGDDSFANAIGSNIFDICIALGFSVFIYTAIHGPIIFAPEIGEHIIELRLMLFILTAITIALFYFSKSLTIKTAGYLLLIYSCFIAFVVGRAYEYHYASVIAEKLHMIQALLP